MNGHPLRQAYEHFAASDPAARWLSSLRQQALERFVAAGFPTQHEEDWKYTSLEPFAARTLDYLGPERAQGAAGPDEALLAQLPAIDGARRILIVDGQVGELPAVATAGLRLRSLSRESETEREQLAGLLTRTADSTLPNLAELNIAFLRDALLIDVDVGASPDEPLHVVHVATGGPVSVQSRVLLRLAAGSRLSLIEHFVSEGAAATNAVTQIHCARGAQLDYLKLQAEADDAHHVAAQTLRLERDSRVEAVHVDIGAGLSRNDQHVDLAEPGAELSLRGLFVGDGQRHLDNHVRIDHRAEHCRSRSAYRGVVGDRAHAVFNGKILVHRGADGTDAALENRNLLLSRRGEIDTKPELEIYADDVKCSHGATTGQLDPAAIFYLRSRGVTTAEARRMLTLAFAGEITRYVRWAQLREHIEQACGSHIDADRAVEQLA